MCMCKNTAFGRTGMPFVGFFMCLIDGVFILSISLLFLWNFCFLVVSVCFSCYEEMGF